MSFAREFAAEWAKMVATVTAVVLGVSVGLFGLLALFGLPVFVGSYIEFGGLSESGVTPLLEAGHTEWLIAQLVWMLILVGAFFAFINVHERRNRAESNGGDSA